MAVEVFWAGGRVWVWDSKLGLLASPFQQWAPREWAQLLEAICEYGPLAEGADSYRHGLPYHHVGIDAVPSCGEVVLGSWGRHEMLRVSFEDWNAFVAGVLADAYEVDRLKSLAELAVRGSGEVVELPIPADGGHDPGSAGSRVLSVVQADIEVAAGTSGLVPAAIKPRLSSPVSVSGGGAGRSVEREDDAFGQAATGTAGEARCGAVPVAADSDVPAGRDGDPAPSVDDSSLTQPGQPGPEYLLAGMCRCGADGDCPCVCWPPKGSPTGQPGPEAGPPPVNPLNTRARHGHDPLIPPASRVLPEAAQPQDSPAGRTDDGTLPSLGAGTGQPGSRWHVGRAWAGHEIEDACPCVQEPCGLVATPDPECGQHSRAKTIRQSHRAGQCPALGAGIAWTEDPSLGESQAAAPASIWALARHARLLGRAMAELVNRWADADEDGQRALWAEVHARSADFAGKLEAVGERFAPDDSLGEGEGPAPAAELPEQLRLAVRQREALARRLNVRFGELEEARAALQQMTDKRDGWRVEAETLADQLGDLRASLSAAEAEVDRLRSCLRLVCPPVSAPDQSTGDGAL